MLLSMNNAKCCYFWVITSNNKTMELRNDRKYKKPEYVIGNLTVNGEWFCNTLEDADIGLTSDMEESTIRRLKIYGKTAIPSGRYKITMDVVSPKFSKYPFYMEVCEGKVPRLLNVKGFDGILIHVANGPRSHELVQGCIGVGLNEQKGMLSNGKRVFSELYKLMKEAHDRGEEIYIQIG